LNCASQIQTLATRLNPYRRHNCKIAQPVVFLKILLIEFTILTEYCKIYLESGFVNSNDVNPPVFMFLIELPCLIHQEGAITLPGEYFL